MKKKSEENQEMTLELTPAVRSYLEAESFATFQKSLSEDGTLPNHYARKLGLRLSLAHFNRPSQVSNTSPESGNEIAMKNDFGSFSHRNNGQFDYPGKKGNLEQLLEDLKQEAVVTNKEFAEKLDVTIGAITYVK